MYIYCRFIQQSDRAGVRVSGILIVDLFNYPIAQESKYRIYFVYFDCRFIQQSDRTGVRVSCLCRTSRSIASNTRSTR